MTDLEKAARMALEALEYYQHRKIEWDYSDDAAITALRQALEQPEQSPLDRIAENARTLGLDYEPVQEPVAWRNAIEAKLREKNA